MSRIFPALLLFTFNLSVPLASAAPPRLGPVVWGSQSFDIRAFNQPVTKIASGPSHNLAIREDGTVVAWGNNENGQCMVPAGLAGVIAVATGDGHSMALKSNGTVVVWGLNARGQATVPAGLTGIVAIAAGGGHCLALKSDGTVAAWGDNRLKQTTIPAGLANVTAIAAGPHYSLAVTNNDTVIHWGADYSDVDSIPAGLNNVIAVAAGWDNCLALRSDGTVVGWGYMSCCGVETPPAGLSGVIAISAGEGHCLALKSDGTVVPWGWSAFGLDTVPAGLAGVIALAAGGRHNVAVKSDGSVIAWGSNEFGQSLFPASVSDLIAIDSAYDDHTLALRSDGTIVAWGYNGTGQASVPAGVENVTAVSAGGYNSMALKSNGTVTTWGYDSLPPPMGLTGVSGISMGDGHALALKSDGTVVAWEKSNYGNANVPAGLNEVVAISGGSMHSLALKSNGTIVGWGYDGSGQTTIPAGLTEVTAISAGRYYSLALKSNGTVVAWGTGNWGSATPPADLTNVIAIAAGDDRSVALKGDGTVVMWGGFPGGNHDVPAGLTGVTAITTGDNLSAALVPIPELPRPEFRLYAGSNISSPEIVHNQIEALNFGNVGAPAGVATRSFTIDNPGTGALNLTASPSRVTLAGSADFSVTSQPQSPVAAASATTFEIAFAPSSAGIKTATVSISSNDPDVNPFTFTVVGEGVAAEPITLTAASHLLYQGATKVQLTLERPTARLASTVTLSAINGPATRFPPFTAAISGVDYAPITGPSSLISFAEGELTKEVTLTLFPKSGAGLPNKVFTVYLDSPTNGAALGAISTAVVKILANDETKPTVTITAPTAKASDLSPLLAKGMTGDARGIERVEVMLNGNLLGNATLGAAKTPTSIPWSLPIVPNEGDNTLTVTAFDLRGNANTVARSFNFVRRYALTLGRTNALAGAVAFSAKPAAGASALSPSAAAADPKRSLVVPGTVVKLTAGAKAGFVFDEWQNLPAGAEVFGNVASFTMPANDVAVTAGFIATPFNAPVGRTNTFIGLLHPTAPPSSNANEGLINGTLTTSGGFTGKIFVDGVAQSINATFFGDGSAIMKSGAVWGNSLTFGGRVLTLAFDFDAAAVTASLVNGASTSTSEATRPLYSSAKTHQVPAALLSSPTATKGFYTLVFPAKEQEPPMDANPFPVGYGFATLSLTNSGGVSLTGTLADGMGITAGSAVLAGDIAPFLVQLPTPGAVAVKGGSFSGELVFENLADSDLSAQDLLWFRAAAVGTGAATHLYTAGWPNGVQVDALGGLYNSTLKVHAALGLPAPDPVNGNAELRFSDGKLMPGITKTNFNISGNTVTKIPGSDGSFMLTLAASTGGFSGSFAPNWANPSSAKPGFKGILLQKGANKGGYGFFISNAKNDQDPESGAVTLGAQE